MPANGEFTPAQRRRVAEAVSRLETIETHQRVLDAERVTVLADALDAVVGGAPGAGQELGYRALRLELAAALSRSESAVERLLDLATSLTSHYTPTLREVEAGRMSLEHARVITDAGTIFTTGDLPTDAARRGVYEAEVLVHARQETPTRLRPIARALAARYSEHTLEERHQEAVTRRCVRLRDLDAGMAELVAFLPAVEAHAIYDRVTRIARATIQEEAATRTASTADTAGKVGTGGKLGTGPEPEPALPHRSRDAVRADVLRDLLLTGTTDNTPLAGPNIHAKVQVIVPLNMLHPDTDPDPNDTGPVAGAGAKSPPSTEQNTGTSTSTAGPAPLKSPAPTAPPPGTASPPNTGSPPGTASPPNPASPPHPATRFTELGRRPTTPLPAPVAELVGYGPIPTTAATRIAHTTPVWEGVFTSPDGDVLAVNRYTPTPEMQRRITARDLHCRAPACRAPAHRCDIDHTIAATDGGPTTTTNLALLCRAHHSLKHHSDWQLTQLPGGTLKWVSPTGRITIDRPPSRVRFSTDPAPSKPRSERSTVPPEDPDTPHPF